MITTYSDYLNHYVVRVPVKDFQVPGEHHFVGAYLLPRLFAIQSIIPDYINPDGTKEKIGDIAYFKDQKHHFGIEVKFLKIRLTRNEFNSWIFRNRPSESPDVFVGVACEGIALTSWTTFRNGYIQTVREKKQLFPSMIESGYGPIRNVSCLEEILPTAEWFPRCNDRKKAQREEKRLLVHLTTLCCPLQELAKRAR